MKFESFQKLCDSVKNTSSHLLKSKLIRDFLADLSTTDKLVLLKLLMIHADSNIYYLDNKQIVKLFSTVFHTNQDDMTQHFNSFGDVSQTIETFAAKSNATKV